MTEASESERRQAEFAERSSTFMEALDVDEVIAQLFASEGFSSVEEVAFVEPSEIASIEGFDENTAAEIQTRAREHLEKIEAELEAKRKALGVADELAEVPGITTAMLVTLGEAQHQDGRGSGRLRHRRSRRLERAQGQRDHPA